MKERTVAENASVQLLPCPFCGERPLPQKRSLLLVHRHNLVHQYKIECHTCSVVMRKTLPISAHVGNDDSPEEDQELNSRWNTRVPAKPEWKTIDSAPKDGRTIICANIEEEPFLGRWVNERFRM